MKLLRKLKIKTRLIVIIALLVVLSSGVAFISLFQLLEKNNAYSKTVELDITEYNNLVQAKDTFLDLRLSMRSLLSYRYHLALVPEAEQEIERHYQEFLETIAMCRTFCLSRDSDHVDVLDDLRLLGARYRAEFDDLYDALLRGRTTGDIELLKNTIEQTGAEIIDQLDAIQDDVLNNGLSYNAQAVQDIKGRIVIGSIIQGMLIIVSIFLSSVVARSITRPIRAIDKVSKRAAEGDMDMDMLEEGSDEIASLNRNIHKMIATFQSIIYDMNRNTAQLNEGLIRKRLNTDHLSGSFQSMAQSYNDAVDQLIADNLEILWYMKEYSDGNLDIFIREFPGEKAIVNEYFSVLETNLNNIVNDINDISRAVGQGDLSKLVNTNKYQGEWKTITEELNNALVGITTPILETIAVLEMHRDGKLNARVQGEYQGVYLNMKTAINESIEQIGAYIREIIAVLQSISDQNLDVSLKLDYAGDFAPFKTTLNSIIDNFNSIIHNIKTSANELSASAKVISETSQNLSRSVDDQDKTVSRVVTTVEFAENLAKENADDAKSANTLASRAKDSAQIGNREMHELLDHMDEIQKSSKDISNIIDVIDNIAFQTNILSLNAAVEAARAGEYGKSFSVVAEEVRELALKSKNAANDITERISSAVDKLDEGYKIAAKTSDTLNEIIKNILDITDIIEKISVSSDLDISSVSDIRIELEGLFRLSQSNSLSSQEGAALSEELSAQADLFNSMVSKFQIKENQEMVMAAAPVYKSASMQLVRKAPEAKPAKEERMDKAYDVESDMKRIGSTGTPKLGKEAMPVSEPEAVKEGERLAEVAVEKERPLNLSSNFMDRTIRKEEKLPKETKAVATAPQNTISNGAATKETERITAAKSSPAPENPTPVTSAKEQAKILELQVKEKLKKSEINFESRDFGKY